MNINLSEFLHPRFSQNWTFARQCGVDDVITLLDGAEQDQRMFAFIGKKPAERGSRGNDKPWSLPRMRDVVEKYSDFGFTVRAVEDTPPLDKARLGQQGRDEQIEDVLEQIEAMRQLEIPILCYNWSAVSGWARTDSAVLSRGGALVTSFRLVDAEELPPLVDEGITHDQLWDSLSYFLDAVVPAAEAAGVRLALHPDDPPVHVLRGLPRIMASVDGFRRLRDLNPSQANAITFCQGNFALMSDDLPGLIQEFGDRIAFIHFRDVRGTAADFVETFHDNGQTDMAMCLRAYETAGYSGPLRADHVPTLAGEPNDRPGYGAYGRLFALGYIRGLLHGIS